MAATGTRPTPTASPRVTRGGGALARDTSSAPAALGVALAVAVLYAFFASGAIGIPEESRLQIGVAALSFATLAALLFGRGLRISGAPLGVPGLALLAGFAAWSGLSITWSIAPDES